MEEIKRKGKFCVVYGNVKEKTLTLCLAESSDALSHEQYAAFFSSNSSSLFLIALPAN